MPRPLVGVTSYVESAQWGVWQTRAVLLPERYVAAVTAAGARPVIVPPAVEGAAETVAALDGLVLAGGADLDPALYGDEPHPRTRGVRRDRDAGELALLHAALAGGIPLLGICRGMQLLTVALGGRLHQHLPDVVGHDGHRTSPGSYARHRVRLEPDSRIGRLLGPEVDVPSYHHQGIAALGKGLVAVGWAEDGSVEAVEPPGADGPEPAAEPPDDGFLLGVLWHPEVGDDGRLFAALTEAAGARRATRG